MNRYIIEEIIPKQGEIRNIHKMMLGSECDLIILRLHHPAWVRYYPDSDQKYGRLAYTSPVEEFNICENDVVTISTKNTLYSLKLIRGSLKEIIGNAD